MITSSSDIIPQNLNDLPSLPWNPQETYDAPIPPIDYWLIAEKVFTRLIFPPILLWDGLKWAVNKLAGEALGNFILPAATPKERIKLEKYANTYNKQRNIKKALESNPNKLRLNPISVITEDNAQLDTLEFSHPQSNEYIIHFRGNGECYEHPDNLEQMVYDANYFQCNVIGFNFRGVNNSNGKAKSKNDLVRDGIAQVYRLLAKNILPENIILKGHSLGAAVATLVADYFHSRGIPVVLFNGCSFSTTTRTAVGHIRAAGKNREDKYSISAILRKNTFKLLGYLAMPLIKLGLALTIWEINAAAAFKRIPGTHKEYMLIRSANKDRDADPNKAVIPVDDTIIPHYSSLYRDEDLRKERRELKEKNKKTLAHIDKQIKKTQKNHDKTLLTYYELIAKKNRLLAKNHQETSDDLNKQILLAHGNNHHILAKYKKLIEGEKEILKENHQETNNTHKQQISKTQQSTARIISQYKELKEEIIDNEKCLLNSRKMVVDNSSNEGHSAKFDELSSRYEGQHKHYQNKTANDFFADFVTRVRNNRRSKRLPIEENTSSHSEDHYPSHICLLGDELSQNESWEYNTLDYKNG